MVGAADVDLIAMSSEKAGSPTQLVVIQHHSSTKNDLKDTTLRRRSSKKVDGSPERDSANDNNEIRSGRVSTTFAQRQKMMAAEESQITIGLNQKEGYGTTMGLGDSSPA